MENGSWIQTPRQRATVTAGWLFSSGRAPKVKMLVLYWGNILVLIDLKLLLSFLPPTLLLGFRCILVSTGEPARNKWTSSSDKVLVCTGLTWISQSLDNSLALGVLNTLSTFCKKLSLKASVVLSIIFSWIMFLKGGVEYKSLQYICVCVHIYLYIYVYTHTHTRVLSPFDPPK